MCRLMFAAVFGSVLVLGCAGARTEADTSLAKARSLPPALCADASAAERVVALDRLPLPLSVDREIHGNIATKVTSIPARYGTTLVVPAPASVSPAWLQRTITCHQADVALGDTQPRADDPFAVPADWLQVDVRADGATLVVRLEPTDRGHSAEVLDRARRWAQRQPAAHAAPVAP